MRLSSGTNTKLRSVNLGSCTSLSEVTLTGMEAADSVSLFECSNLQSLILSDSTIADLNLVGCTSTMLSEVNLSGVNSMDNEITVHITDGAFTEGDFITDGTLTVHLITE